MHEITLIHAIWWNLLDVSGWEEVLSNGTHVELTINPIAFTLTIWWIMIKNSSDIIHREGRKVPAFLTTIQLCSWLFHIISVNLANRVVWLLKKQGRSVKKAQKQTGTSYSRKHLSNSLCRPKLYILVPDRDIFGGHMSPFEMVDQSEQHVCLYLTIEICINSMKNRSVLDYKCLSVLR